MWGVRNQAMGNAGQLANLPGHCVNLLSHGHNPLVSASPAILSTNRKTMTPARRKYTNSRSKKRMQQLLAMILWMGLTVAGWGGIIEFDISPSGKDIATGLSPRNQLFGGLPPEASTGSGGELNGGIAFDTVTGVLNFDFGYGSGFGFSDLSEAAFAWLLHGGASPQATGPVVVNLEQFHSFANPQEAGGRVVGAIIFPELWRDELISGLTYINVYTINNPGGEIRGQLIRSSPVDVPEGPWPTALPVLFCIILTFSCVSYAHARRTPG